MVYKDRWWIVDDADNALFYKSTASPQCNPNQRMVELWVSKFSSPVRALFIPWAYVPIRLSDYE
jgi:hypothetical protein